MGQDSRRRPATRRGTVLFSRDHTLDANNHLTQSQEPTAVAASREAGGGPLDYFRTTQTPERSANPKTK